MGGNTGECTQSKGMRSYLLSAERPVHMISSRDLPRAASCSAFPITIANHCSLNSPRQTVLLLLNGNSLPDLRCCISLMHVRLTLYVILQILCRRVFSLVSSGNISTTGRHESLDRLTVLYLLCKCGAGKLGLQASRTSLGEMSSSRWLSSGKILNHS